MSSHREASLSPAMSPVAASSNSAMQHNASTATNTRSILAIFNKYEKDRLLFAQTVADIASREQNIEILEQSNVVALFKPLLIDSQPSIKQAAAVTLGRIANNSMQSAQQLIDQGVLTDLVANLDAQNKFFKKAAAFVLRAIARHSPELAHAVVAAGSLTSLCHCLEEFDPGVKEAAAWAIGYIARHDADLAQSVVMSGAIPLLVLCLQEPELVLKRIAASALSDISKHTPGLAQAVVQAQCIPLLTQLLNSNDPKLKRQICSCLSQIAKHSVELAETVVDGQIFPRALTVLHDSDPFVRKYGATLLCEIAKHTPELAQLIVNSGGLPALIDYTAQAEGSAKLPGIMSIGYIAAFSETLAAAVVLAKGIPPLSAALDENEAHLRAAAAWSLGQVGRHSAEHAKLVAEEGALLKLLQTMMAAGEDEVGQDLKLKTKRALKSIIEKTVLTEALEPLLQLSTPPSIFKYVISQFAKVLPNDVAARRSFVTTGALQRVQEFAYALKRAAAAANAEAAQKGTPSVAENDTNSYGPGSKIYDSIKSVNECFPEEIVKYYSPGYSSTLLEKIDGFGKTSDALEPREGSARSSAAPAPTNEQVAPTASNPAAQLSSI